MTARRDFIRARLDEDTTIPEAVKAALRALTAMHDGHPDCDGCGADDYGGRVLVSDCEELAEIAAIWKRRPGYEES